MEIVHDFFRTADKEALHIIDDAFNIAKKIDYKIYDKELMEVIAREEKISSDLIKTLDEGKASSIEIWVESLLKGEALDEYDYITKLTKVINSLADAGKGIFLGRASHIILASGSGIRVRIVDKFENRIKNMRRYDNIDETAAVKILKESDKDRAKFLKTYFNSDINNPLQYDLVINCSGFDSVDDIADIIICSLKKAKIKKSGVTK